MPEVWHTLPVWWPGCTPGLKSTSTTTSFSWPTPLRCLRESIPGRGARLRVAGVSVGRVRVQRPHTRHLAGRPGSPEVSRGPAPSPWLELAELPVEGHSGARPQGQPPVCHCLRGVRSGRPHSLGSSSSAPRGLHNPSTDLLVTALVYTGGILHAVRACRSGPTAPYLRPVCPLHLGGGRLPGPRRQRGPRQ